MDFNSIYLTAKQVSTLLNIPLRTIHRISKQGKIKAIKIGGRWFYPKKEIEKYFLFASDFSNTPVTRYQDPPERRSYPRMNCEIRCDYLTNLSKNNQMREGLIRNISGSGVLIYADSSVLQDINIEDPISLDFTLNGDMKNIKTEGRIVRKTQNSFGVKFRNINKEYQDEIASYVG